MQPIMDALWEKAESPLQRSDRQHINERKKRRERRKHIVWYVLLAALLFSTILYMCLFIK